MSKSNEEVNKEFDEKWLNERAFSTVIPAKGVLCFDAKEIKEFISSLRLSDRASTLKEVREYVRKYIKDNRDQIERLDRYVLDNLEEFLNKLQ